jgi:hypothetical protein
MSNYKTFSNICFTVVGIVTTRAGADVFVTRDAGASNAPLSTEIALDKATADQCTYTCMASGCTSDPHGLVMEKADNGYATN